MPETAIWVANPFCRSTHFWCGWCSVTVQFVASVHLNDTICWCGDVFRINILRKRPILLVHLINIHNGYAFRINILYLQNQHSVPPGKDQTCSHFLAPFPIDSYIQHSLSLKLTSLQSQNRQKCWCRIFRIPVLDRRSDSPKICQYFPKLSAINQHKSESISNCYCYKQT